MKANGTRHKQNEKAIRIWMLTQEIKSVQIRKALQLSSGAVTRFLSGEFTSNRLQTYFVNLGCPRRYFINGRVKKN